MKNLRVAVCKPDHLGDFILAIPALRQLRQAGAALTLFIASNNFGLARYYCPDAELVALDMPHLRRDPSAGAWTKAYGQLGKLRSFDLVVFLRRDNFFHPDQFAQWTDAAVFIEDRNDLHQTQLEHAVVSKLVGPYDVEASFSAQSSRRFPGDPKRVVFAIGAGFPHKKWSPLLWAHLGQMLQARGIEVRILAGPAEVSEGGLIARSLGVSGEEGVFIGGGDFKALENWLDESDVVIAVDGGGAHLSSIRKPVLGIFGPSPTARYAPIGASSRAISRDLRCAPCPGFDRRVLNACMSRECLYGLRPHSVLEALFLPSFLPGQKIALDGPDRAHVRFGLSSAPPRRDAAIATRIVEHD